MRTSRQQQSRMQEWLVLALVVGLSLTLLFFGKNQGVMLVRGELADVISIIVQPFSRIGNVVNMWQDYDDMRMRAMELSLENSALRDAVLENERLRAMLEFKQRSELELIPASVIARTGAAASGRFRLNAGIVDGVQIN